MYLSSVSSYQMVNMEPEPYTVVMQDTAIQVSDGVSGEKADKDASQTHASTTAVPLMQLLGFGLFDVGWNAPSHQKSEGEKSASPEESSCV